MPVPMDVIDALALFPVGLTHNLSRHFTSAIRAIGPMYAYGSADRFGL
jgi:hypothetical protein